MVLQVSVCYRQVSVCYRRGTTSVCMPPCVCRCRKLPRALKEWQAYEELRKTIEDFNDMVPLLELMANKAMKPRHWKRIAELTGHTFDIESENFTLRNILQAPLLENKEEIEVRAGVVVHVVVSTSHVYVVAARTSVYLLYKSCCSEFLGGFLQTAQTSANAGVL